MTENPKDGAIPTIGQRRRAADIGEQVSMADLAKLGSITWLSKEEAQAMLPETGEVTQGFYCRVRSDDGVPYGVFVGQQVLKKDLAEIELPFRARVIRKGRTYLFVD